jgi:hypothetical protein
MVKWPQVGQPTKRNTPCGMASMPGIPLNGPPLGCICLLLPHTGHAACRATSGSSLQGRLQHKMRRHVGAAAPEGCWISQWRVGLGGEGCPEDIQGTVLNDGTPLLELLGCCVDDVGEYTIVGEAGGSFTDVQGR